MVFILFSFLSIFSFAQIGAIEGFIDVQGFNEKRIFTFLDVSKGPFDKDISRLYKDVFVPFYQKHSVKGKSKKEILSLFLKLRRKLSCALTKEMLYDQREIYTDRLSKLDRLYTFLKQNKALCKLMTTSACLEAKYTFLFQDGKLLEGIALQRAIFSFYGNRKKYKDIYAILFIDKEVVKDLRRLLKNRILIQNDDMENVVSNVISTLSFVKSEIISLELYKTQAAFWESKLLVRIFRWIVGWLFCNDGLSGIALGFFVIVAADIPSWFAAIFFPLGFSLIYVGVKFIIPRRINVYSA